MNYTLILLIFSFYSNFISAKTLYPITCDDWILDFYNPCEYGYNCIDGFCTKPKKCISSSQCGFGYDCIDKVCKKLETCTYDSPCYSLGYDCIDGFCQTLINCISNYDCKSNYECIAGYCKKGSQILEPCNNQNKYSCNIGYGCIDGYCKKLKYCNYNYECESGRKCIDDYCREPMNCTNTYHCFPNYKCIDKLCKKQKECTYSYQCEFGYDCIDNICNKQKLCTSNTQCRFGYDCIKNYCNSQKPCTSKYQCVSGYYCIDGFCTSTNINECTYSYNCKPNYDCVGGSCQKVRSDVDVSDYYNRFIIGFSVALLLFTISVVTCICTKKRRLIARPPPLRNGSAASLNGGTNSTIQLLAGLQDVPPQYNDIYTIGPQPRIIKPPTYEEAMTQAGWLSPELFSAQETNPERPLSSESSATVEVRDNRAFEVESNPQINSQSRPLPEYSPYTAAN